MSNKKRAGNASYKSYEPARTKTASIMLLLPVIFILTVLPLIVKIHDYNSGLSQFGWFSTEASDNYVDFFLYYKQWFFVAISGIMLIIICIRAYMDKKTLRFIPACIPLAVYALLALLSTIFSDYPEFGFSGIFEQFESVFCLLGYALVVYYILLIVHTEYEVHLLIDALAVGSLILCTIGTFQAIGLDFYMSDFGKSLIANGQDINIVFGEGRTYSSLYNPNYVGMYTAFIIPIFSVILLHSKKRYQYILYSSVILTAVISMFGSQSKAGFISIIVSALFIALIMRRRLMKRWYILVPMVVIIIGSFFIINKINDNAYINAIKTALTFTKTPTPSLESINTLKDGIEIKYNGNEFVASYDIDSTNTFSFYALDSDQQPLETSFGENGIIQVIDDRFSSISIFPVQFGEDLGNKIGFGIKIDNFDWYFTNDTEDGSYKYLNRYGKFVPIESVETSVLKGYEGIASKRGYIWSRTIPLLKDHIILGSGADTFGIEFPQFDYVGFYNNGYYDQFISKPHCLYLQVAVQTGILSLIAMLVFYMMYFISSLRIYMKKGIDSPLYPVGVAIFVGTISYMISAISNDSSISVAPVFWAIIGLGLAVNHIINKNSESLNESKH